MQQLMFISKNWKNVTPRTKKMHELLSKGDSFAVVDIETTGLSPLKGGKIIEIAGVMLHNGEIVSQFHELINPEMKIGPKTTKLTKITNEMVEGKRKIHQVLPEFYKWLGNVPFIAHNAIFDWNRFLLFELGRVGINATNPVICSAALSKFYLADLGKHGLQEVCDACSVTLTDHHRALDDTLALAKVIQLFKKEIVPAINKKENLSFEKEVEQISLLEPVKREEFKVKRVSYWEKQVTKSKVFKRLYVMLDIGSVYYDYLSESWFNKDVSCTLDFSEIEERVLRYVRKSDLCDLMESQV